MIFSDDLARSDGAIWSDKPDLRIDLELVSIDDLMKDVEFKVFSGPQTMKKAVSRRSGARWREDQPQRN